MLTPRLTLLFSMVLMDILMVSLQTFLCGKSQRIE